MQLLYIRQPTTTDAPLVAASHVVVCFSFLDSLASYSAFALSSSCQRNLALPGALNGTCFAWNPGPYVRIFRHASFAVFQATQAMLAS